MALFYIECSLNRCQNGGICTSNTTSYTCTCQSPSYGNNCQYFVDPNTSSTILNATTLQSLNKLLNASPKVSLLYRASRDGFSSYNFHSKVDGVHGTFTLIKSINSNIFGGYTSLDWSGNSPSAGMMGPQYDSNAFIFSLVNAYNYPTKMNVTNPQNAIQIGQANHITFGGYSTMSNENNYMDTGNDLTVSNDGSSCVSHLGNSYQMPSNISYPTSQYFLGGSQNFQLFEIEVYSVDRVFFFIFLHMNLLFSN